MPQHKLGPVEHTQRGFALIKFKDRYDHDCTIQQSSLATENALWLGIADPDPQILARDAAQFGVKTDQTVGWVPYPIPEEVQISTRMHLSVQNVRDLAAVLQHWLQTGQLGGEPAPRSLRVQLDEMTADRDHWKANHDNLTARNAVLRGRPDVPVDRKELEKALAERDAYKELYRLAKNVLKDTRNQVDEVQMNLAELQHLRDSLSQAPE